MKRILFWGIFLALAISCSVNEMDLFDGLAGETFYATIEQPCDTDTKVYVNNDLKVLWDEGDHISIFNKKDANDEYRFTGKTGDNGGSFELVKDFSEEGVSIDKIYAVYPYSRTTSIDTKGILTVEFPSEQHFRENSFGPGANMMVSVSKNKDNNLQFKNAGGFLRITLYGEGISVSSITLKGNNGEKLAGKASVTMPLDGTPTAVLVDDAAEEITLVCDTPVVLGATAEKSKDFWFVVPPVTFSKGFAIKVISDGGVFEKTTSKQITIERNHLSKMSPICVILEQAHNIIYYTTTDGNIIQPYSSNWGANLVSNEYIDGRGVLTFDGDVTSVGSFAFLGKDHLLSIVLPESITSIEPLAFINCSSLSSITIPDSVTVIEYSAFSGCSSLSSITLPKSITRINGSTFSGCSNLASITIPDSVESIEQEAFSNCSSLTSIFIPASVTSIGESAFSDCSALSSIFVDPDNQAYDSRDNCNAVIESSTNKLIAGCKDTMIPKSVTSIGVNAFRGCTGLTSIIIPDSVTAIGNGAFDGCINLESITIPESMTEFGEGILSSCPNLKSINGRRELVVNGVIIAFASAGLDSYTIPEGVTEIGANAFRGCNLSSITVPVFVTSIGPNAFRDCIKLTSAVLEGGGEIWNSVFQDCSNLSSVMIGDHVTYIGESVFYDCCSLVSVSIPETVSSIEGNTFFGCSSLESVVIPNTINRIGYSAFFNCSSLTDITIPESVTTIGSCAFLNCSSLVSIVIPESVTRIERSTFSGCRGLSSITIPESVANIDLSAFSGCSSLTSIDIPEAVTSIEEGTVAGCSALTSVSLGESVTSIGQGPVARR